MPITTRKSPKKGNLLWRRIIPVRFGYGRWVVAERLVGAAPPGLWGVNVEMCVQEAGWVIWICQWPEAKMRWQKRASCRGCSDNKEMTEATVGKAANEWRM